MLPCKAAAVQALPDRAAELHHALAFYQEPADLWLVLPADLQAAIEGGHFAAELATLQQHCLILIRVEVA
jgi:hypothetical protein